MDWVQGLVTLITNLVKIHRVNEWAKLYFSLAFSFAVSGSFVMGTALVAKASYAMALGSGLIAAAVSATVVFRTNPLTKGLSVALPAEEAGTELNTNIQIITKV